MRKLNSAFTLIEVSMAAMISILVIGILLLVFANCLCLNITSRNLTTAMCAAQAKVEEIFQHDFATLASAYDAGGTPGSSFLINGWVPTHSGIISLIDDGSDQPDNLTDSNLIQFTITVCWQERGGRIIGEDSNLDGVFDAATEDKNGNGRLDSPAQLISLMTRH